MQPGHDDIIVSQCLLLFNVFRPLPDIPVNADIHCPRVKIDEEEIRKKSGQSKCIACPDGSSADGKRCLSPRDRLCRPFIRDVVPHALEDSNNQEDSGSEHCS